MRTVLPSGGSAPSVDAAVTSECGDAEPSACKTRLSESDLYTVSDRIQRNMKHTASARKDAEQATWLAGIAEVELPIEYVAFLFFSFLFFSFVSLFSCVSFDRYKLKNIEDTERAKRSALLSGDLNEYFFLDLFLSLH